MEHGGGEIVCKPPSPVRRHAHRCRRGLPVHREQATASSWVSIHRAPPAHVALCKNREPGWDGGGVILFCHLAVGPLDGSPASRSSDKHANSHTSQIPRKPSSAYNGKSYLLRCLAVAGLWIVPPCSHFRKTEWQGKTSLSLFLLELLEPAKMLSLRG